GRRRRTKHRLRALRRRGLRAGTRRWRRSRARSGRVITFEAVAKRYRNGREALQNVSLHVAPGEMVFLTGRSGAGKSTVLKLIALLERPTRGTVTVGGQNTSKLRSGKIPAYR